MNTTTKFDNLVAFKTIKAPRNSEIKFIVCSTTPVPPTPIEVSFQATRDDNTEHTVSASVVGYALVERRYLDSDADTCGEQSYHPVVMGNFNDGEGFRVTIPALIVSCRV